MKLLLSGEGPSDLGACGNALGRCDGADFRIGPMTVLLSQLAEPQLRYALLDTPDSLHFISETTLCEQAKARPVRLRPTRSKKQDVETAYYYGNAYMLGQLAQALAAASDEPVLAVLFRDNDGTRSSAGSLWKSKWKSMQDGFAHAGFAHGVPMLPKPKSEAWLLSAALPHAPSYAHLEEVSGNDDSPNSAKAQLKKALGHDHSSEELCDWLQANPFDTARAVSMPSFKQFQEAFEAALQRVLH
jgi:hypothetical protein